MGEGKLPRYGFLVAHRARMLASPHSVSENGAPAAIFISLAEAAIDHSRGAEVSSSQACSAKL
jgi:hypothetical protein